MRHYEPEEAQEFLLTFETDFSILSEAQRNFIFALYEISQNQRRDTKLIRKRMKGLQTIVHRHLPDIINHIRGNKINCLDQ